MSSKKKEESPAVQATPVKVERAGKGGVFPPVEHRFQPGVSANPGGSRTAGAHLREWLNAMSKWTRDEIQGVYDDDKSTAAERGAAKQWLDTMSGEVSAAGVPIAGSAFDRVSDRTDGKPQQRVTVDTASLQATLDLTRLTVEQVGQFRQLLAIATNTTLPDEQPVLEGPR